MIHIFLSFISMLFILEEKDIKHIVVYICFLLQKYPTVCSHSCLVVSKATLRIVLACECYDMRSRL